jgi:ribosomal-protein-alanine N-acetyltransferase
MDLKLRALRTEEYPRVWAWAAAEAWPGLVKGSVLTEDDFSKILGLPGHVSFALSDEGQPALGFGQIWHAPTGKTNLVRLLVDPAMRGKGFGKRLCSLLLAEALRTPNVERVCLRVRKDNAPAVAVYRSLGFRELEEESNADVLAMACEGGPATPSDA